MRAMGWLLKYNVFCIIVNFTPHSEYCSYTRIQMPRPIDAPSISIQPKIGKPF